MKHNGRRTFVQIVLSVVIGLVLGLLISEGTYRFNNGGPDRAPTRIELVVPAGTADRITAGGKIDTLPEEMTFIEGDELVVINQDDTSHQLGPIWVPAQSSGSILLDRADKYSYDCSFQATRFMGLNVQTRVTTSTRMQAMLVLGLPLGGLLAVYSFAVGIKPGKKEGDE